MQTRETLNKKLLGLDGRGYKAYKDIKGEYDFGFCVMSIDHVQGDPFAAPSRLSVRVPTQQAGFNPDMLESRIRRTALGDFLARAFFRAAGDRSNRSRGSGKSGLITIDTCGQEILERTAVLVTPRFVEARFVAGLPAAGRTILGREASAMLCADVPDIVRRSLLADSMDMTAARAHLQAAADQQALRSSLADRGLVAFVADGSILPRRSGIDDRPMHADDQPVAFVSPPGLRTVLSLPGGEEISGMGIPTGITLIAGGGFHGKSTLLRALERSVYNHVPGDGRERVVTDERAVKIRAEDGRSVKKVTIDPFISNLPRQKETVRFSTDNASGSTSQAANIIEAIEMGAGTLLIDEDTSATNFMIRDERMQELVAKQKEPITPFIDKVQKLYADRGISTILVTGGSGDYFDVADTVIMLDTYRPRCVTKEAAEIAGRYPRRRADEGGSEFGRIVRRRALPESFDPRRGRREVKIDAKGLHTILYGEERIDLSAVEQLVDQSQTRSIGSVMHRVSSCAGAGNNGIDLRLAVENVLSEVDRDGLDVLCSSKRGDMALPRTFEVLAAINRMRSLKIR